MNVTEMVFLLCCFMEEAPPRGQECGAAGEVITENVSMGAAEENGRVLRS